MIKDGICPVCQEKHERLSFHVSIKHPEYSQDCDVYRVYDCGSRLFEMKL